MNYIMNMYNFLCTFHTCKLLYPPVSIAPSHTLIYALLHSAMREQLSQYLVGPARRHIGTAWKHWNSGIDNWIAAIQCCMLCMHLYCYSKETYFKKEVRGICDASNLCACGLLELYAVQIVATLILNDIKCMANDNSCKLKIM